MRNFSLHKIAAPAPSEVGQQASLVKPPYISGAFLT
jgi:hypothetical protein